MRHYYSLLLLFITTLFFSWLNALRLDAESTPPPAVTSSCSASANHSATCSSNKLDVSFPFLTSDECRDTSSSFVISHCDQSDAHPVWPGFTKDATEDSPLSSMVVDSYIPHYSSYTSAQYGYITLTWSTHLLNQNACISFADVEQISQYIPRSINLQEFAHSAFNLDSTNIILLLNCDPTKADSSSYMQPNSTACGDYKSECKQAKDESYNCYQYKIPSPFKELNLTEVMDTSACKQVMFFDASISSVFSKWKPGLIRLNWQTTGTDWLPSILQDCARCSSSNGLCGYDSLGQFQCCGTNCSYENTNVPSPSPQADALPRHFDADDRPGCASLLSCNIGARIAIGVGVTGVIAVLIFLAVCCLCKAKVHGIFTKSVQRRQELSKMSSHPTHNLDLEKLTERPVELSYSSIISATNNFNNVLGEGGFGVVYWGSLTGMHIAVKVGREVTSEHRRHFLNEVATIGRIHHVHVIRLLGFCLEQHHRILVYEYFNNGSLDNWLFKHKNDYKPLLNWTQRYDIAVGIAKGLGYLHEECRHQIVHCDIKPQNILLDEHLCPKIADFGLAKLMARDESPVATMARGTPGYMAPELWMGQEAQISTKFDVYSYGMMLLELISGHRNFANGSCFPEEAFEAAMKGDTQAIVDVKLGITMPAKDEPAILNTMEQSKNVRRALFVALWCIQDYPMSRPHMSEVVLYLEGKLAIDEHPPRPTIACMLLSLSSQESSNRGHNITSSSSGR